MQEDDFADQSPGPSVKLARLIAEYGLDGLGEELERRWSAEGDERSSLRELANAVNRRLVETALDRAGVRPIEGEPDNLYRLLTDADVSTSARTQADTRLERAGVDPDALRDDFVSHQAVHTYLRKVRDVEPPETRGAAGDPLDNRQQSIQRLRSRLVAVTKQGIRSLRSTDRLTIGTFDVTVGITIHCRDCNGSYGLTELFDRGRCGCA